MPRFVAGEAGIGKTRLAAELARAVHGEGALVLYGRCDEGLAVPYQPWVEALRPARSGDWARSPRRRARAPRSRPRAPAARAGRLGATRERRPRDRALQAVRGRHRADRDRDARAARAARARRPALGGHANAAAAAPRPPLRAAAPERLSSARIARRSSTPRIRCASSWRTCSATPARRPCASADSTSAAIAALLEAAAGHALDERAAEFVRVLRAETGRQPVLHPRGARAPGRIGGAVPRRRALDNRSRGRRARGARGTSLR